MATSNGRIALVTGSAQGIGRSIALRLANDGFDIAVNDIPSKAESLEDLKHEIINDKGRKAVVVVGDVSKEEDVKQMIESVVESLGSLDVVSICRSVAISFLDSNLLLVRWWRMQGSAYYQHSSTVGLS